MREGGLRRGHSPGYRGVSRSRSRSRSPSRSWSRSRSRSRSRSPYDGRRGSPPGRYSSRSPHRRYSRSPSPVRKRRAGPAAPSDSSDEPGQVRGDRDRRGRQQPEPQQHQQAPRRQGANPEQVQALRQQLESEQVARAAAESKAELLRTKLREVAERSKARGNTLAALLSAVRTVADAKQQLSAAEAALHQALQDADAFLQEKAAAAPMPAPAAPAAPPPQPEQQQQQWQEQQHEHAWEPAAANGTDEPMHGSLPPPAAAAAAAAAAAEQAQQAGGWVQASTASPPRPKQAPLSNIKFSLKL